MAESNPGPSWYESVALQLSQLAFLYQVLIKQLLIRLRSWCCTGARGLSLLLNALRHWHQRWRLTFTRSVGATHSADSFYSSKARRRGGTASTAIWQNMAGGDWPVLKHRCFYDENSKCTNMLKKPAKIRRLWMIPCKFTQIFEEK